MSRAAEPLPPRVVDEAIAWAVKLDFGTPTPRARAAFERWLQAAPVHASAWERVQSLRGDFAAVPPALALGTLHAADAQRQRRRQGLRLLGLAGMAVAAGWTVREHAPWQRLLADASTGVGEQRTLRLDDGTTVVLNTDTALSSALSPELRTLKLHRGEILVTTGADAGAPARRPFWVQTPFGALQALGTRFVVRLEPGRARISVQEGAVQMHPAEDTASRMARPGDAWWLGATGAQPAPPLGFDADGWADGVVAGQGMRLADLLAELERYRHGRIVCDERVAGLRVSGVYHVRDTDQALQFLLQTQPVEVVYRTRLWVAVGPSAQG
jgi:transmembrane sensor